MSSDTGMTIAGGICSRMGMARLATKPHTVAATLPTYGISEITVWMT